MCSFKIKNISKTIFLSFLISSIVPLLINAEEVSIDKKKHPEKASSNNKNTKPERRVKPDKKNTDIQKKEKIKKETNDLLSRNNSLAGEKIILQKQLINNNKAIQDMNGLISENENILLISKKDVKKTEDLLNALKEEWKQMPKKKEIIGREITRIKKSLLAADYSKNDDLAKKLGQELQSKLISFQEIKLTITKNIAEREKVACSFEEKKQAKKNIESNIKNYKNEVFRLKKSNSQIQNQIESVNKKTVETKDKILENDFKLNLNTLEM